MLFIYPLNEKDLKNNLKDKVEKLIKEGINCFDLCFSKEKDLFSVLDILKEYKVKISLDVPKRILLKALKRVNCFLINSSYPDKESLNYYLKLAKDFDTSLVVLSIFKRKPKMDLEARKNLIEKVVEFTQRKKFPLERLFIDLIILPFKYYPKRAYFPLFVGSYIKKRYPSLKTLCGIDNFTYPDNNLLLKKYLFYLLLPYLDAFISKSLLLSK
jgi:5-methyltetrahydrofolate corrinoid/iron sulfur protein methyltransferase